MKNIHELALALLATLQQQAHYADSHANGVEVGMAVAEGSDCAQKASEENGESHGLGNLGFGQLRPLRAKAFGEQVLPRDLSARLALDRHSKLCRGLAVAVGNVLQVPARGAALTGKSLALFRVELEEVRFEVHGLELHHSVLYLSTSFDVHQTVKCSHGR